MNFTAGGKARTFKIVANNLSDENKYIQQVTLDGKPLRKPFISHKQIVNGHELIFEMGAKPAYHWK
jgi:putative alpha-1,2-mannosidase